MKYIDKKQVNSRRSTVRNGLRSERNRALEIQKKGALDILNRSRREVSRTSRQETAVLYATAELAGKVLGAFGVDVPLRVSVLYEGHPVPLTAWTNFKEISVNAKANVNLNDLEAVAQYIWMLKGAVYHEGGHCLFTIPLPQLMSTLERDAFTNVFARQVRDRYISSGYGADSMATGLLRRSWNILEDQRMEMAMVATSPVLATYLTTVVLNVVVNKQDIGGSWPYVSGRMYIPYDIRKGIRAEAMKRPAQAAIINQIDSVVARYRVAKTVAEMVQAIMDFHALMDSWGWGQFDDQMATGQHVGSLRERSNIPKMPEMDESPGDYSDDPNAGTMDSNNGSGGDGGEDGDPDKTGNTGPSKSSDDNEMGTNGQGSAQTGNSSNNGNQNSPNSTGTTAPAPPASAAGTGKGSNGLRDLINKAIEDNKPSVTDEVMTFATKVNEELRNDLPRDPTSRTMDADSVAAAVEVKQGIITTLEHLIDQTSPSWRFRQEYGVLDPTAYVMREPGDTDYWSGMDGVGGQGYDLAVSVVLDTSYSMEYQMVELSQVGLGVRLACDELDIPCSVSTFNSGEYALYRVGDPTVPTSVRADGGTEPFGILSMLDTQRFDKKKHLVLILTDGEWSDVQSLSPFAAPGRYFMLLGLGMYDDRALARKGANHTLTIRQLSELPKQFTRALAGFMA